MAIEITIPRLGWSMDEGVFVAWLKSDGDPVRAGEPLFSLQGEKATQDVDAIDDGTLRIPPSAPKPGATVAVGAVIGYLVAKGESDPPVMLSIRPASHNSSEAAPTSSIRSELDEAISTRDDKPRSSPLARRVAREHGIDWTRLTGSGSSGRIRKVDVLEALRLQQDSGQTQAQPEPIQPPLTGPIRRTIAARMVESHRTTAPVTLTSTADASNLVALRTQFKAAGQTEGVPSFLDFLVKLTALTLREHPLLNARWDEDKSGIMVSDEVHVGIAIETEAGLVVPVIRDAADLGIRAIASCSRELIANARHGKLQPKDLRGGTFTLTNLGAFGIEYFTPIINPPECAILGVGKIERVPVMSGDQVVGREQIYLSLTFDHRIVDGAPAARFLQRLVRLVENPSPWLMS